MSLQKPPPTEKPPAQEGGLVEWFLDDFVPRFGKQSLYVLAAAAALVIAFFFFKASREGQEARENKELGQAYVWFAEDKLDSAQPFLSAFVQKSHSRIVQDKANLLLGKVYYQQGKYDEAIKAYGAVDHGAKDRALIASGALHGLASAKIQKKDYAGAAQDLEKFVATFMVKTGKPGENVEGQEVVDLSPSVPNALWKLALCYRELKDTAKAKATAEKLVKVYPESREAFDAQRLLAQLTP